MAALIALGFAAGAALSAVFGWPCGPPLAWLAVAALFHVAIFGEPHRPA